jgi:probable HAF family extracellular repeat protein
MNSKTWTRIIALALFAALAVPVQLAAQDNQDHHQQHHHYKLIDIGTFGGPASQFSVPSSAGLNNRGTATGVADTSLPDPYSPNCFFDCFVDHAFVSRDGITTDLGTLPGGPSSFAYTVNKRGLIVGQSQNGSIDPLTGLPEVRGVLWRNGQIVDLGTLGGNASNANAINHGQVVGGATNATSDPFANVPQAACQVLTTTGQCSGFTFAYNALFSNSTTETHAFLWQDSLMFDLGTLGGPDSTALINNDRGQVAGWSYTSFVANPSTGTPTVDPFLWSLEDGKMVDLGSLGGTFGAPFFINSRGQVIGVSNLAGDLIVHPFLWSKSEGMKDLGTLGGTYAHPNWINDKGEVVGFSDLAGGQTGHAFLWRHGVMTDLGTLGNDPASEAGSINSWGQIVGGTFIFAGPDLRGWLWEHGGPLVDLENLVLPGSGLTVIAGNLINDEGEIAGRGMLPNGDTHAILLIPCDDNHAEVEGCDYDLMDTSAEASKNPASVVRRSMTTAPRTHQFGRIPGHRLGPLSHIPVLITDSVDEVKTPISRDSWQLQDKLVPFDRAERASESSSNDAAQRPQSCYHIGLSCFGPGPTRCCPAPFPHHSFCSSRTGWGRCLMN